MIFIYNDYGGTHTTSLAAAYHLKKLPTDRVLTKEEILNVDYFNKLTRADFGKLIFHGIDEDKNSVYTIGRKSNKLVVPALKNLSMVLQEKYQGQEKIIFSRHIPDGSICFDNGWAVLKRLENRLHWCTFPNCRCKTMLS